ncbi:KilA-N domain-containing protein [Aeromonas sanarellii]|nr:KilA-N domain-containing protein [Aeromonas sanarellii]
MNTQLTIANHSISITANGMYNLNDLHKAAIAQGKATASHKPSEFKRFHSDFIAAVEAKAGLPALVTTRGGNRPGTWAVELVAMKYAGWIDTTYEVDVYAAAQAARRSESEALHRQLAELTDNDIPFPPVASELHKCSGQQLAKALCHKLGTTRYMLSIEPDSGSMSGRHGGDSLTLWPVAERACVIDPTNPSDMQRMLDLMSNDDLADLMKLTLASVTRRTKSLMQPR